MHIVEQSRDRLVIEARKAAPMWQPAFVVVLLTAPLLITGAWKVIAFVAVIWAITAAIYAAIIRSSAVPRIELDANSGRAKIGRYEYALATIRGVSTTAVSNTAALTIRLRDAGANETDFSSARTSTPAERVRIAKIINEFLDAHRDRATLPSEDYVAPYEDEAGIDEVDSDEVDSDKEPKGPGWAEAWDAESTARRKCFFCGTRDGDAAPLQLWANREREGEKELELLFVPRCRRCRRIHNVHGRFIAPLAIIAGLIGGFALYRVSGYTALIFATPVAAFFLGLLVTSPRTFGSRSRNDWRQIPELQRAMQDGWKLRARQEGVP